MKQKKSFAAKLHSIENGISIVQNNPEVKELIARIALYEKPLIKMFYARLNKIKVFYSNIFYNF
jgi:uncharacterized LabA/DUF88 family protein